MLRYYSPAALSRAVAFCRRRSWASALRDSMNEYSASVTLLTHFRSRIFSSKSSAKKNRRLFPLGVPIGSRSPSWTKYVTPSASVWRIRATSSAVKRGWSIWIRMRPCEKWTVKEMEGVAKKTSDREKPCPDSKCGSERLWRLAFFLSALPALMVERMPAGMGCRQRMLREWRTPLSFT
jgi:hypothetical protein